MATLNATSDGGSLETASHKPVAMSRETIFSPRLWKMCLLAKSRALIALLRLGAGRSGMGFQSRPRPVLRHYLRSGWAAGLVAHSGVIECSCARAAVRR